MVLNCDENLVYGYIFIFLCVFFLFILLSWKRKKNSYNIFGENDKKLIFYKLMEIRLEFIVIMMNFEMFWIRYV